MLLVTLTAIGFEFDFIFEIQGNRLTSECMQPVQITTGVEHLTFFGFRLHCLITF